MSCARGSRPATTRGRRPEQQVTADGVRLDAELVRRGFARSRSQAREAVAEGRVRVAGVAALKPGQRVAPNAALELREADPWVARSAHKLNAALEAFDIPVTGRLCLDIGASTGGFTQVLLGHGARTVIALDVGHDQLVPELRDDRRVLVVEGANARELDRTRLTAWSGTDERPELVVVDVSFIPLALILPGVAAVLAPGGSVVALVKPQFEVGRAGVREGLVRDRSRRQDAARRVLAAAHAAGLGIHGVLDSPIVGSRGNREYLIWLTAELAGDPTQWETRVASLL
ncbi:MAG: TlyA family RNA methyltransferase [Micrococcales bacterium]|nr:TlyA family RNA methyltransferase [Micrococcales bacterium]